MSSFDEEWKELRAWYSEPPAVCEQEAVAEQEKHGLRRDSLANDRMQIVHQEFLKKRRELYAKYGKSEASAAPAPAKEAPKNYQADLYKILCQK